jgi:hypothetical protein
MLLCHIPHPLWAWHTAVLPILPHATFGFVIEVQAPL